MCLSPLTIHPKSVYPNALYDLSSVSVGCKRCDECREQYRLEWQNRLCFEYSSNAGGCAVFLTFTYNNDSLPFYEDRDYILETGTHFRVPCFSREHVLKFLHTLKRYYIKRFGYVPFKYFFASEYGKTTKRPHYHALFFLDAFLAHDWRSFVEVCREIWSQPSDIEHPLTGIHSLNYGFVFPKMTRPHVVNNRVVSCLYLDQHGKDRSPLIHDAAGGMSYCSKYVCKDLSYFTPLVNNYLANALPHKVESFKSVLPKHWQSNKLGYSAVSLVMSNVEDSLSNGICNPLTLRKVSIPSYVVNQLLYVNVFNGRFSPTSGKKLYDRYLSDFGIKYLNTFFHNRVLRCAEKMFVRFQQIPNVSVVLSRIHVNLLKCSVSDYIPLALFHCFIKNLKSTLIDDILTFTRGSLTDLFDLDFMSKYYYLTKSTEYKNTHPSLPTESHCFEMSDFSEVFKDFTIADSLYCEKCRDVNEDELNKRLDCHERIQHHRELYTHGYPLNLC